MGGSKGGNLYKSCCCSKQWARRPSSHAFPPYYIPQIINCIEVMEEISTQHVAVVNRLWEYVCIRHYRGNVLMLWYVVQ